MKYDFLIVGSGLFGSVFSFLACKEGYKCLVIDKRNHFGGNIYCDNVAGINVHKYGAHIFHTDSLDVWNFVNQFVSFNRYTNSPLANYKGELYNLPFNMNTFHQMFGVTTPDEARKKIAEQRGKYANIKPQNLEEQALQLVGHDIYEKLIKGYTEKQWGCKATELPSFIIRRLPLRFTYDNNYFNDRFQGIPENGYNELIDALLKDSDCVANADFFKDRKYFESLAKTIVYTGSIDSYFDYCYGELDYRGLAFETEVLPIDNYQGNAVINYTDDKTPFTRIIEHKHFYNGSQPTTVITKEYSQHWKLNGEAYYPINNERNELIASKYRALAFRENNVVFGGRLADYKYYDMDDVIESAFIKFKLYGKKN